MINYENTGNIIPRVLLSSPGKLNLLFVDENMESCLWLFINGLWQTSSISSDLEMIDENIHALIDNFVIFDEDP